MEGGTIAPRWHLNPAPQGQEPAWSPPRSIAGSAHPQTIHLQLSFCIAGVFLKQLGISELDRSALLRI